MTACGDSRSVFDLCPDDETLIGLREVNSHPNTKPATHELEERSAEDVRHRERSLLRDVSDKMVCSACRCSFTNREEQTEHYKLDWHRFNLRQKVAGMAPATAEEFEEKTGAGDMSSISGSDSEDEEEDESDREGSGTSGNAAASEDNGVAGGRISSKVVFQNSTGQYVSVYRCILQGKSGGEQDIGSSFTTIHKKMLWVVLMTGGGHFAGAVFQGKDVLQHKTFHRYTVRAKRGTAQGLRDSQNRGHAPKSAGAALRRHNEAALVKDIQDLLLSWAEHLQEASAIFVRAPTYNKSIFFGGRRAPLLKTDPRIRTLPFATRRATFREVQRVHAVLSTVVIYEKDTDMSALSSVSKKVWKKKVQPAAQPNTDEDKENNQESSDQEEGGEIQLETVEVTLKTTDLKEFDVQGSRNKRKKKRRRKRKENEGGEEDEDEDEDAAETEERKPEKNKQEAGDGGLLMSREPPSLSSGEFGLRDALFTACKVGDVEGLCTLLHVPAETPEQSELVLLNQPVDSSGFTLLHVASAAAQRTTLRLLLDAGADPACRDNKGRTPYTVAPDKDTRNVFRKYMGENPDRYDYSKAQVPGPLTAEIEGKKAEKKKAQRAQRKQREKTQRDEQRRQELEEEEKKRFASLSEREKRALAAERRLAEQGAATGVGLSNVRRCWLCGESLLGKIPFQYLDFSFCTPRCVQAHRKAART